MEGTQVDSKKLAQQYVQELLLKVEQIDGKDSRELVKNDIRDAGKDVSKLKVLVRELTTNYAPELMDRWEDIVRKIDETAQATPPYGAASGPSPIARTPQPAHHAHHAQQQHLSHVPATQPHHHATQATVATVAQPPFPAAPGGNPMLAGRGISASASTSASNCAACRGKHQKHTCEKAKAITPGSAPRVEVAGPARPTIATEGPGAPRPVAAPGVVAQPVQAVSVVARGPPGIVPGVVPAGEGGMGNQHGLQGAGGDMGMSAGAKRQREEAEEAQERRTRQMEREAMPRQEKVLKERKQGKGDVALDPRREPDPIVLAMIRQACEMRLRQVAKVRTEKLRYEAAKASRHQVKLTLQPMLLLNKAENDAQNGQQAGGALAASNQAALHALNAGSKAGGDAGPGKRKIELRDMLFLLERDPLLRKSPLMYRAFLRAHEDYSKKLTATAEKRNAEVLLESEKLAQKLRGATVAAGVGMLASAAQFSSTPPVVPPGMRQAAAGHVSSGQLSSAQMLPASQSQGQHQMPGAPGVGAGALPGGHPAVATRPPASAPGMAPQVPGQHVGR